MCKYRRLWVFLLPLFLGSAGIVRAQRVVDFTRVTIDSNLYSPHGDWAGDIDGTSLPYELDALATVSRWGYMVWYENLGQGKSWSVRKDIWAPNPTKLNFETAAADLDGNGTIDAVSVDLSLDGTSYLLLHTNTGGGSFTTDIIGDVNGRYRQMRLRDVDNDNDSDIVITVMAWDVQTETGLFWYENTGGMVFDEHFIETCNPWKVDCFDDDGDDHLEMVVSEGQHGGTDTLDPCRLIYYKNLGNEIFASTVIDNSFPAGAYAGGAGVRCADFDGDGKIDIVSGDMGNGILYWYKNQGGSSFQRDTIDANCSAIDGIDIGDFEPDGDMDIVVAGRNYWLRWYENDGNGNFTPRLIDNQYPLFDLPYVTYLDGDTCPDIIVTEASDWGRIFAYLNPCPPQGTEESQLSTLNSQLLTLKVYPNPATTKASIKFRVQSLELKDKKLLTLNSSEGFCEQLLTLKIHDLSGRLVRSLPITDNQTPNTEVIWDGRDAEGKKVNSGIYFYSVKYKDSGAKGKFVILK